MLDKRSIQREIACFVKSCPDRVQTKTRWKKPLIASASVEDRLFQKLKVWVRPSHALPQDLLSTGKTVIAYFLPFENRVQEENAKEESYPSRSWAVAYLETNRLIQDLNEHLKHFLENAGFRTVYTPATHNYDPSILLSDWSHRHIAYIAGLGRLGLNNWLITEKGCCGRIGSFVTEAILSPTPRPEQEFCLHKAGFQCSACIKMCTYGALFPDRFDRHTCNRQLLKNDAYFSDLGTADVCGKCGCGLPCSTSNPVTLRKRRKV
ncbi:MAG TPA: epoxyqueuosine reductase [Thermodesulfobacteriota bacterium]|nr:epoxyqueuosine reductase [Thermodesulfobacteriota bacterium]